MKPGQVRDRIPEELFRILSSEVEEFRPAQQKAIKAGLLDGKSLLVCTPTASGKTLIAELAAVKSILGRRGKAVYVVPLRALASEKYRDFRKRYGNLMKIALCTGDLDSPESRLSDFDLYICTSEKLDSLLRHHAPWLSDVRVVIIDEIHLLNDPGRGPTLEILITMLRQLLRKMQFIGLSATIGNSEELSEWLGAELVADDWRPVKLHQGIYYEDKIDFRK